jgi:hypothetical protein
MADDSANIHNVTENTRHAGDRLEALAQTSGAGGVAQRAMRGDMKRAAQAPSAAPADGLRLFAGKASGGGGYGYAAGRSAASGPAVAGAAPAAEAAAAPMSDSSGVGLNDAGRDLSYGREVAKDAESAEKNMRNVGNRTFYRQNGQWVDSQVTKAQQQNARRVKQFSDDYFSLSRRYGRTMSQYLAFDEPVMLNLDGEAYLIEP